MSDDNVKSDATPEGATPAPTPAPPPTVVAAERSTASWVRPLVIAACLVGALVVGGIGGFVLGSVVGAPRGPLVVHMAGPGSGDFPHHRPGQRPGDGPDQDQGQEGPRPTPDDGE